MRVSGIFASLLLLTGSSALPAQSPVDAQWIWFDEGDPVNNAPDGKVWFRREVRAFEPSTGIVRIAADDQFVLWVNGERIGQGRKERGHRFLLSGIVERGLNVIAVEATNLSGRAGLLVDGEVRGQGGHAISFDSGSEWKATRTAPTGDAWMRPRFDDSGWKPAKSLGPHKSSPWKAVAFGDSYLDRFQTQPGFELRRVAEPGLVGSLVAISWGNRGRLLASRERGPVFSLIDGDGDGNFEKAVAFTNQVVNCQGLCMVADDLFVVGDGPQGTGIYRLPDRNHDDRADEVVPIVQHKGGMGEHGPHAIVVGPDGWLYHNSGNHAWITNSPQPTSPVRNPYEGDLLQPRFEDAGGHAVGIKVPGGTNWRFSPDGKKWWMVTNGFRNHYDIAFNAEGELFTFDSDMEWDVGLPWYRPVRVNHCIPGAEFGWRSGSAKWPVHHFDSLPTTVDIGRGSPTGVVFYEHHQFPGKYQGAFLVCDWSMGRIIAVFLKPDGATYSGNWETLVSGNPLNVSDIEVDRDGSVVFATGGRNTEGGVFRLSYSGPRSTISTAATAPEESKLLMAALTQPQPSAAWAREELARIKDRLGPDWGPQLVHAAKQATEPALRISALRLLSEYGPKPSSEVLIERTTDKNARVRAFATFLLGDHAIANVGHVLQRLLADSDNTVRRRACEAYVRSGLEPPAGALIGLLGNDDRWLRFAARLALERVPVAKWREHLLSQTNPRVLVNGLLGLHRLGPEALPASRALDLELQLLGRADSSETRTDVLRMIQLSLMAGGNGPAVAAIGERVAREFPCGHEPFDVESIRLLAYLQVPGTAERLTALLTGPMSHQAAIHTFLCLRFLSKGWTADSNAALLKWYETTGDWEGGHSLQGYLSNIMEGSLHHYSGRELAGCLERWPDFPLTNRLLLERAEPDRVADFVAVIERLLNKAEKLTNQSGREETITLATNALGRSSSSQAQALLRRLYDEQPDRRGNLARNLARHATKDNWPYLLRSLSFADDTTLQVCTSALAQIDRKPEKPDDIRSVILAGLKLRNKGGLAAANLLQKWTGVKHDKDRAAPAMAVYQNWFREKYPDEPDPALPSSDAAAAKFTMPQLVEFLDANPRGLQGNPTNGKLVFAKINCIKCHRFGNEGEGVGPDLTTVRRRFQRKEIVESLLHPSAVISDQYRSLTVATRDGQVHSGMALPSPPDKLILLLSDATRLEIARGNVESRRPSKVSVMPDNQLNTLSLDEIADLFAFLETSKNNPEPEKPAGGR